MRHPFFFAAIATTLLFAACGGGSAAEPAPTGQAVRTATATAEASNTTTATASPTRAASATPSPEPSATPAVATPEAPVATATPTTAAQPTTAPTQAQSPATATPPPPTPTQPPASNNPMSATIGASTARNIWSPSRVTIGVGGTVTWAWTNAPQLHNVAGSNFPLGPTDFKATESVSFTFTAAGVYSFSCQSHPEMKGTVTVQ